MEIITKTTVLWIDLQSKLFKLSVKKTTHNFFITCRQYDNLATLAFKYYFFEN